MPTYCIPLLSSVPGSPASEFDWWTVASTPASLRTSPENPNWLGSFSLSDGSGANRDMQFRVLRGALGAQSYLFLSWVVRVSQLVSDTQTSPPLDRVNVVLGDGTNYLAFRARLGTSSETNAGTQDNNIFSYRIHRCSVNTGTLTLGGQVSGVDAPWLEETGRMWVDTTNTDRQLHIDWAFQIAIPLNTLLCPNGPTLPISGAFKLWYEVWATLGTTANLEQVPYTMPTTSPVTTSVSDIIPQNLNVIHMLDLSTGNVGCTAGVELTWGNVGVRNVAPTDPPRSSTTSIRLDLGQDYPPNKAEPTSGGTLYKNEFDTPSDPHTPNVALSKYQNQFFATPTFPMGFDVNKREAIRATFSLANWGSQIGQGSSWTPIPGGTDVQFLNVNGDARFVWPTPTTDVGPNSFTTKLVRNINKYLNHVWNNTLATVPEARHPHQCVLVELFSDDNSVVITRSSIYQNMNVTRASVAREPARISIEGLTPIGAEPRDVYLYLQTFNMPKEVKDSDREGVLRSFDLRQGMTAIQRTQLHGGEGEGPQSWEVEDIAAFYPTYIVHVYHDTGNKMTLENGRQVPILRPQTAFGHFVSHEGSLVGWETRLYGAEKIADNFYRLRVPNNGAKYIETAIQARESANDAPLPSDEATGCHRLISWLETKGLLGRLFAMIVRILCRLFGQ